MVVVLVPARCFGRRLALGLPLAVVLASLAVASAKAADFRADEAVAVRAGETLRDDLYAVGRSVVVDGTIEGDLFAAAQEVIVRGRVTGSLFAAAQTVLISGSVEGDVRVAGQEVRIDRSVSGDLMAAAQTVALSEGGSVGRDALVLGQVITMDGPVERSVWGAGELVLLNASVGGSVDLWAVETLRLGSRARIAGDLRYQSARDAAREPGSEVRGLVSRQEPPEDRRPEAGDRIGGTIFGILAVTVVGAAALALTPTGTSAAGRAVTQQALLSLGWGFGLLIGIPIFATLLLVTFVGIPLALMVLVLYAILLYTTQAIVSLGVGRLVLSRWRHVESPAWSLGAVAVGSAILGVLRAVPILDGITTFVVLVLGLGGMWLAYLEVRSIGGMRHEA